MRKCPHCGEPAEVLFYDARLLPSSAAVCLSCIKFFWGYGFLFVTKECRCFHPQIIRGDYEYAAEGAVRD